MGVVHAMSFVATRTILMRRERGTSKLCNSFPMLAHAAQVELPVTAVEILCERLFSSSGCTMTFDRASLGSDTMRALVMWKQNGRTLGPI